MFTHKKSKMTLDKSSCEIALHTLQELDDLVYFGVEVKIDELIWDIRSRT